MLRIASRTLKLDAMRDVYVAHQGIGVREFEALVDGTARINAMDLGGFTWHVPYLARDTHPEIPWAVHLQAWAAALQIPYAGIEDFYRRAIAAKVFPAWLLNQTSFYEATGPIERMPLGRLLVRLGLISVADLQLALGIQALIKEETGLPTRIGRVLSNIRPLSLPDMTRAITIHLGLPYTSLELTLPVIERSVD